MQLWTLHSQLFVSISYNNVESAEEILRQPDIDPDIKFRLGSGNLIPAICLCAEKGLYEMAKLFINYGCSINSIDENGFTALHFAANHQNASLVSLLIGKRGNVNATTHYGASPLHFAASSSSVEIVKMLVEAGSTLERKNRDGRTPLSLACLLQRTEIVEYLVKCGANVNSTDNCANTPLLHAINSGLCLNGIMVSTLLKAGANPNQRNNNGQTPLITAIRRSSDTCLDGINIVSNLIEKDCKLNETDSSSGENAFHLSITRGQDRITEILLRSGCDLNGHNSREHSPIHRLAKEEKTDLVKLMLAAGTNISMSKDFYIDESGAVVDMVDQDLKKLLQVHSKTFPRLKHLARVRVRKWLGRRADPIIKQLSMPIQLKKYLLLLEL